MPTSPDTEPLILDALRTPFGKRKGALRNTRPEALLAHAISHLLARTPLPPARIGDVLTGCVSQAGEQGANIGRQAALLAGLPDSVPGATINRMCGSSQYAVHACAQAIAAGDIDFALATGVESMSRVPMFLDLTLGRHAFADFSALNPDLLARYPIPHQVESAERIADQWSISRAEADGWALESHRRAQVARLAGWHREILPTEGIDADSQPLILSYDEGIRAAPDADKMAAMAPVFREPGQGVVTAANASQMSDGAAAILLGSRTAARQVGIQPRARFLARVVVGSDPVMQLTGVLAATRLALAKANLSIAALDWIELNEAFASVVLCFIREFKPDTDKLNPWGGAIAHGHPLGATGAGLMAKMLTGLEHTGGQLGLQVMCIGHGMATATIIERQ